MSFGKPKKRFSQNFLIDDNISAKIVKLLELTENDTVFEIGSGRGALTQLIAESKAKLFSFEIDRSLIKRLIPKFEDSYNVEIIKADFLKINPTDFYEGTFKLVGNIPYDITSPLINWIHNHRKLISRAVLTTQKELADRICSGHGNKNWAPISIFSQCFFDIQHVMNIKPGAFFPPPKVNSATILMIPEEKYEISNYELFEQVVRQSFKQRRKLLVNNLSELDSLDKDKINSILEKLGFGLNCRAEQLSIPDFIKLADEIEKLKKS